MKKSILYLSLFLFAGAMLAVYSSCQKIPNGFLTSYPYYDQSPMVIGKGYPFNSAPLETIGSTIPMNVKILHVYDANSGALLDSIFLKKYPFTIFTSYYDPKVDTTLAMVNAIRKLVDTFAINVNSANGSFQANFNTIHLPTGSYTFDLQISNSAGTKTYPKIAEFILQDTLPYAIPDLQYDKLYKVGNESVSKLVKNPIVTVQYVADTPNVVIVKIVDKNGVPFDPSKEEIIKRPNPGGVGFLQTYDDYAISSYNTDTSMNYIYPFAPFPSSPLDKLPNSGLVYYRIPTQFIHFDESQFLDNEWSANPRFRSRFYVPGEYLMTVILPDITHR